MRLPHSWMGGARALLPVALVACFWLGCGGCVGEPTPLDGPPATGAPDAHTPTNDNGNDNETPSPGGGDSGTPPGQPMTDPSNPTNPTDPPTNPPVQAQKRPFAYVGGSNGNITRYRVDATTGAWSDPRVVSPGGGPSFLAFHPNGRFLYAVLESASQVAAFSISAEDGTLAEIGQRRSSGGSGPAHLSVDKSGRWVLASNYGSGHIATLRIAANGTLSAPTDTKQAGANAHFIDTDAANAFVFVPCLGSDHIAVYAFNADTGALTFKNAPASSATGAGPRHLAFHPNGRRAYVINELNSTVDAFAYDASTGTLTREGTVSTRAPGASGNNSTAEIVVHPSGGYVLGSNRGEDSLVVFSVDANTGALTRVGNANTPTGGQHPRSFTLARGGSWAWVANQNSGSVRLFRFDASTGTLSAEPTLNVSVSGPQFVGSLELPALEMP